MKAGIITIFDITNYGNRLQNYAVQYVLRQLGLTVVTYGCEPQRVTIKNSIKYLIHRATRYKLAGSASYWKKYRKLLSFYFFNEKYIKYKYYKTVDKIDKSADCFVIGSDQVWNPTWFDVPECKKEAFLLSFIEKEKKICFAPSFGLEHLPEVWKPWFTKYLNDMEYISVRENAGAAIVKELTGKEAEVLIDPTLMLSRQEWLKVARRPKYMKDGRAYIFVFFIGKVPEQAKKDMDFLVQKHDLKVVNIMDCTREEYVAGPDEFVYLISKAKIILTDSFHASIFSFIFDRPFWIYDRVNGEEMNSRLDTFLQKFDLTRKKKTCVDEADDFEADYKTGKMLLCHEQEKVHAFLHKSMKNIRK